MKSEANAWTPRGFCPTLWKPLESGDGLIVRLETGPLGRLKVADLRQIVGISSRYANGLIELTRRGRIQLRGVRRESLVPLRDALCAVGLASASADRERKGTLVVNPLAGLDPACAELDALAHELDDALFGLPERAILPDKFGVVLDSGGYLGDIALDVRVEVGGDVGGLAHVSVARSRAGSEWLGACPVERVVMVVTSLASMLAKQLPGRRMRELVELRGIAGLREGVSQLLSAAATPMATTAVHLERVVGSHVGARDWLGVGVPFGSGGGDLWSKLSDIAGYFGVESMLLTPFRCLLLPGVSRERARAALDMLHDAGLITRADDPLLRVVACSGAPSCDAAHGETRELARQLGRSLLPGLSDRARLHVSGCSKSCAHSGKTALTLVHDSEGSRVGFGKSVAELRDVAAEPLERALARLTEVSRQGG